MGGICSCFDGGESADAKQQRREEELLSSEEARSKAADAAQRRQQDFEKSAAGRAAKAQMAAMAKQSANANRGEPVLKIHGRLVEVYSFELSRVEVTKYGIWLSRFEVVV